MEAIVTGDGPAVERLLAASPVLATARLEKGATRQAAKENRLGGIGHYVYAGDTAMRATLRSMSPQLHTGSTSSDG
jgi:hypothetical protein